MLAVIEEQRIWQRVRAPDLADEVTLFIIDDRFYKDYEAFPLRRLDVARMAANLKLLGARVTAINFLYDLPSSITGEDEEAAALFREAGNVVLSSVYERQEGHEIRFYHPYKPYAEVTSWGYLNLPSASSLVETLSRQYLLEADHYENEWPMPVQVVAKYLETQPSMNPGFLSIGDKINVPVDRSASILIDYPDIRMAGARIVSAWDILHLDEVDDIRKQQLRNLADDRIVMLGDASMMSQNYFHTPIGTLFGIEIVASIVSSLLHSNLRTAPFWLDSVQSILMITLVIGIWRHQPRRRRLWMTGGVYVAWIISIGCLYVFNGLALSISYGLMAGILSIVFLKPGHTTRDSSNTKQKPVVFISHASEDQPFVGEHIVDFLRENGIEPWYSQEAIRLATDWERSIVKGLKECDWFMLVLSPNAINSEWVKDELFWAIENRPDHVIPVLISECNPQDLHIRLNRLQFIDFAKDIDASQQEILGFLDDVMKQTDTRSADDHSTDGPIEESQNQ
ncbi:MAG: TIR domain-containing protein [Pseudomonadales bacterium]|nr:TIR domain-containing protein [Pseudomonadales bacterium]MDP7357384.1 TIR domain-containing protein [Pseudomonadales bacterium]MDP7596617.1 TIR domain-containing protein [Pseudomonadales bacterium]HJN53415.1 TIR domain-containing protein [Pseudomonadales bacterium]